MVITKFLCPAGEINEYKMFQSFTNIVKKRDISIFILAIIFSMILMMTGSDVKGIIGSIVRLFFFPAQKFISTTDEIVQIKKENESLKIKLTELSMEKSQFLDIIQENLRLKALLEYTRTSLREMKIARVIGIEGDRTVNCIIVDKGLESGLRENMAVLTPEGLVGRLIETGSKTSIVQLLVNRDAKVSAYTDRTKNLGILKWSHGRTCYFDNIPLRADVKKDDRIITSGLGGVFPKGILVGTVIYVSQKEHELFQHIIVKPAVDFTHLEEVIIITDINNLAHRYDFSKLRHRLMEAPVGD